MTMKAFMASPWITRLLMLSVLTCAACCPVCATLIAGPEFGVAGISTSAQGNQDYVDVCAGNGMYLAVWQDRRAGNYDVYGILLDSAGNPLSEESFLISKMPGGAAAANDQLYPAVGWNGTYFLVAWADRRAANYIPRIYATRVTTSGQVLDEGGLPFPTAATPADQITPSVASNGTNWQVVWRDTGTSGSADIYTASVSSSGTVSSRVGLAFTTNNEQFPDIAWNGTYYLVVWEDLRNSETYGTDIYGCQVSSAGSKVTGSEKLISTSSNLAIPASGNQTAPSVAATSGAWMVVWQDARSTDSDIYCTRVSGVGSNMTIHNAGGVLVSTVTTNHQEEPGIGWDGTNYVVAWRDFNASRGIRAARVSASSVVQDPGGISVTDDSAGSYGPAVASMTGGSLVVWYSLSMSNSNVYGATVTSGGSPGATAEFSLCLQDQASFDVAYDGTNYVVVWSDKRSGAYQIYAARVAANGTILDPDGILVSPVLSAAQTEPAISWNGTHFLVVWTDLASIYDTHTNIKGIRLTAALTRADANPIALCSADLDQNAPDVAWSGTQWLVVWVDYRAGVAPNYYSDLRFIRVSAAGALIPSDTSLSIATNNQLNPTVTSMGGNFLAAWEDYRASGSPVIYSARISSTGVVLDPSTPTTPGGVQVSGTTAWQQSPSATTDGTNYFVTWTDKRVSWSNDNIYGQRLAVGTALTRLDPTDILICGSTGAQTSPSAAWNGANYLVTWQDRRTSATTGDDIYLNQVSSAGAIMDPADSIISTGPLAEITPMVCAANSGSALVLYSNLLFETHRTSGRVVVQAPPTPVVTDDGAFSTMPSSLHASWTCGPREPEVAEYRYAIGTTPGGTNVLGYTSVGTASQATATGLSLVDGGVYYFTVQARNAAGTWGDPGVSDGIVVDASAPSTPIVTDDGPYSTSSTTLHATWSSSDAQTGIVEYRYAIGTSAGGTDIADWTSTGTSTEVTRAGLTLVDGTTCYFSVQAQNAAGLWSAVGSSDGILVDTTAPAIPTVTDDGEYSISATTLHATWTSPDPHSSIEEYQYSIGTSAGATDVVEWTSAGTDTQVTKTGLTLTDGATYYFNAKARNAAGLWSGVGSSDGVMVDASAPSLPIVTDDGAYTASLDSLHATWTSSDPHSGIVEYRYAVGTSAGGNNVVDWTSAGEGDEVTVTGLTLNNGVSYYFSVQALNAAGTWTESGTSDGIMVDSTGPSVPVVTDDGDYTQSLDTLHGAWSSTDAESGIAEYRYAIGTAPGRNDLVDWTSAGTDIEVIRTGLTLVQGTAYCFSVEAMNGAGIWSAWGASNGIMVDASAPSVPVVTDDGTYGASLDSLHAVWISTDPHTIIQEYQYAIGTLADPTAVRGWTSTGTSAGVTATGLTLSEGTVYFVKVKAQNAAGLWSGVGSSDGIQIDATAPTVPEVTDDGAYSTSIDTLHATWGASDPQSGILEYQYAIGTAAGATDILGWTTAGVNTEVTRNGLTLTEGATYYVSVKARNNAGAWSDFGASDGIVVDASAPTTPVVADDGEYTLTLESLHAVWSSTDPHTGVQEYRYAIGTSAGATDVVGWTSAGTNTQVTKTGLSLSEGTTYFFAVQARNAAGLWSSVGTSDGITTASEPPAAPVVTDDGDYTLQDTIHAIWTAEDPFSMIEEYSYAIGTSAGASNVVGWTSAGSNTEVTRTGLALSQGTTYYVSVKARNSAGVWGDVGSSDGVTVPPAVNKIIDAKFMADLSGLRLSGKIASAGTSSLPDLPGEAYFYIEESDRLCGIKVVSAQSVPTGAVVDIAGKLETVDGERQITASVVRVVSTGATVPGVLNMMDKALGGAALNGYTPGVNRSYGPNNLGLLIKTWGIVSYAGEASEGFFYLNGGNSLRDGSGNAGVKVYCGALAKPALGSAVVVTGISSCEPIAGESARRVLATEIVEYP